MCITHDSGSMHASRCCNCRFYLSQVGAGVWVPPLQRRACVGSRAPSDTNQVPLTCLSSASGCPGPFLFGRLVLSVHLGKVDISGPGGQIWASRWVSWAPHLTIDGSTRGSGTPPKLAFINEFGRQSCINSQGSHGDACI